MFLCKQLSVALFEVWLPKVSKTENGTGGTAEAETLNRRNCVHLSHSMAEHAGEKETALPHQRGEQEHPAPSKTYSGAKPRRLMRLLGEFAPICPQRFLTLPCHGFLAVTRAVLLGGFLSTCTQLHQAMHPLASHSKVALFSCWAAGAAGLPSTDLCPADFCYHSQAVCYLEGLQCCFFGISSKFAFSSSCSKLQHTAPLLVWDWGKAFGHEFWLWHSRAVSTEL